MIKLPNDLKLLGTKLIQERYRHAHHAIIVFRNGVCMRNVYRIEIVIFPVADTTNVLMFRISYVIFHRHQL